MRNLSQGSWSPVAVPLTIAGLLTLLAIVASAPLGAQRPNLLESDTTPDFFLSPENAVQPTRVIDGASGAELGAGFPFGPFAGGNRIAAGDLNDDGVADIVAGMGPGGSFVQLFDGATIASLGGGLPFGAFGGGVFLAVGDLNGDGRNDIGISQGPGGGLVRVFNGVDYSVLLSLAPFGGGYSGGVSIAMGDLNADGRSDLIVGQLTGGLVSIIDGATQATIVSGPPFGGHQGGVHVAAGDINNDGRADIILAPATGGGVVVVFDLQTVSQIGTFFPYGAAFTSGVRLAAADLTADGRADIITGPGPGGGAEVRVFSGAGFGQIRSLPAYGGNYSSGVFVAATAPAPVRFTSPASATFTVGQPASFTVRTTALPPVTTITQSGTLPAGVTFTDLGNGTASVSGTPTGPGGSFALTFAAIRGGRQAATQSFTLNVQQAPVFTSAAAATFSVGGARTFTITASGFPAPTISSSGTLPAGLTFTAGANGSATIAGTPQAGTAGSYPVTLTATNPISSTVQAFVLTVDSAPVFTSAATTTFSMGQPGSFTVTVGGARPVTAITRSGALPTGVTFTYNGGGTATIAGTPAPATGGTYPLTFTATNDQAVSTQQAFTFIVDMAPDAIDDTYANGVGNTQYVVGGGAPGTPAVVVSGTVLGNDRGIGTLTTGPALIQTTHGGQVTMAPNGTFTYTPAVGFAGPADTFVYTLTDVQNRSDTAVVTINLSSVVWYVNASAAGGNGRSHAPFTTLPAALAVATAGHRVYVHPGAYTGSVTLLPAQAVWGSGSPFSLNGLVIPPTTAPVLGGTLTLANGVSVTGLTVNGGGGAAIVGTGLTGTETLSNVSISGGASGLTLTGMAGTLSVAGGTFSGVTGAEVQINGGTGTVTIGAAILNSTGGRAIDVQNRAAGSVSFTGAITDTTGAGSGIVLNANAGSTVAFSGGLALNTGANDAFTATGGGTVTVTQNNTSIVNTLRTSTATALRVVNTEIGSAGLTFRRIDAGVNFLTPGVGILLDSTGVGAGNGGLTVSGSSLEPSPSGGLIQRKSGPDGSVTSGVGMYLNNTKNPSFNNIGMVEFENAAIIGRNVYGLQVTNSTIEGAGTAIGVADAPVVLGTPSPSGANGLIGIGLIRDTTITGGFEHNVRVYHHAGSMSLRIDGTVPFPPPVPCLVGFNSTTTGGDGVAVEVDGTGVGAVVVEQCIIRGNRLAAVRGTAAGSASLTVSVDNSIVASTGGQEGIVLGNSDDADLTTTITGNQFSMFPGSAIRIGQAASASAASELRATISDGNLIESVSESLVSPIAFSFNGVGSHARVRIDNNTVNQYGAPPGISLDTPAPGSSPQVDTTITNNHVDMRSWRIPNSTDPADYGPWGVIVRSTQAAPINLCANIRLNTSHWKPISVGAGGGIQIQQATSAIFRLERGTQTLGTAPLTVLTENNATGPFGPSTAQVLGTVAVVDNGVCLVP